MKWTIMYSFPAESKKAAVLWNLELESLRGDLGLLGYPSKEVQLQVS